MVVAMKWIYMCILQLGAEGLSTKALADRPNMKWVIRGVVGGVIPLFMMSYIYMYVYLLIRMFKNMWVLPFSYRIHTRVYMYQLLQLVQDNEHFIYDFIEKCSSGQDQHMKYKIGRAHVWTPVTL